MKKYTDLFLDLDDTLYDTYGNAMIALKEIFESFHLEVYAGDFDTFVQHYWRSNTKIWNQYAHGKITRDQLDQQRFMNPLSELSDVPPQEAFCMEVNEAFLNLCVVQKGLIEGAVHLLENLREKGYRMHICSNGVRKNQIIKMTSSGLIGYFDTIITSDDVGIAKPAIAFWQYALQQTGANSKNTLMIGDNYETDILGAQSVGIDGMLFNRWQKDFVPPKPVAFVVNELKEIEHIL